MVGLGSERGLLIPCVLKAAKAPIFVDLFTLCSYSGLGDFLGVIDMQLLFSFEGDPFLSRIRNRLLSVYRFPRDIPRRDAVGQLVKSMVGARTRDEVSVRVFRRLRGHYPSWGMLRRAAPQQIEDIIWMVRHADLKAMQLPLALRMIVARTNDLDLSFLGNWREQEAMQWLTCLPGVGPSIAASVLNFSTLRKRELVIDTSIRRVGARLGLLSATSDYQTAHDDFMRLVPESWDGDDLSQLYRLLKALGRTVCTARMPACRRCPLKGLCPRHK